MAWLGWDLAALAFLLLCWAGVLASAACGARANAARLAASRQVFHVCIVFSLFGGDVNAGGIERGKVLRGDGDEKAAFAAVDVDGGQRVDAGFYEHGQRGFGAEGAGAANEVACPFVGLVGLGGFYVLHAELAGEVARGDVFVAVHDAD